MQLIISVWPLKNWICAYTPPKVRLSMIRRIGLFQKNTFNFNFNFTFTESLKGIMCWTAFILHCIWTQFDQFLILVNWLLLQWFPYRHRHNSIIVIVIVSFFLFCLNKWLRSPLVNKEPSQNIYFIFCVTCSEWAVEVTARSNFRNVLRNFRCHVGSNKETCAQVAEAVLFLFAA